MRTLALAILALCVVGMAYSDPPPPQGHDPISIDKNSPSVLGFGNTPADIYGEALGGGLGGWDVGGPGPVLHIKDLTYGLIAADEQDGHSLGHNNPNWLPIVYFSGSRWSRGRWNTQYRHQAIRNQAAGDRFVTNGWMDRSPANSYVTGIPANLVVWWPGFGPNLLSANQTRYNEIPTLPPGAVNPQGSPQQIDDMDALELHPMDVDGDHKHNFPLFFTLQQGSPSMPPGRCGADIFVSWPGAPAFALWAAAASMGLATTDEMDALVVFHVSGNEEAVPGTDYALFSLRPGNSLNANPSDVYVTCFQGLSRLYFTGQTIGMLAKDDVDGLDIEQFIEGQSHPQVWDEIMDPVLPPPVPVGPARQNPDGTPVNVSGIVTYMVSNFLYIEAPDRSAGIRVEPLSPTPWYVSLGDDLQVIGNLGTSDGERVIIPTQPVSPITFNNPLPPELDMRTRDIGGASYDANNPGVTNGRGALNVGLRMQVIGKVDGIAPSALNQYYYVWDGANYTNTAVYDGNPDGYLGVRIEAPCPTTVGSWVDIDGIASTDAAVVTGSVIPTVIPRSTGTSPTWATVTDAVPWDTIYPGESGVMVPYWNLIGLPAIPNDWDPLTIFSPYDPSAGNLYRWEAAAESWIVYDQWSPGSYGGMLLGDGSYLNPDSDWSVSYVGTYREHDEWLTMPLGLGKWTILAQTFGHNTLWEDCFVHSGMDVKTVRDAATAGWLNSTGWWFENTTGSLRTMDLPEGFPNSCKLLVWHGVWLQSNNPQISVIVPQSPQALPDPYSYP